MLLSKFQFHYGSVKSRIAGKRLYEMSIFQFHYGSVKSGLKSNQMTSLVRNFNSTMVRLKD